MHVLRLAKARQLCHRAADIIYGLDKGLAG